MNSFQAPQRQTNPEVAAKHRARAWLRPYMSRFPAWHEKASLISARMLARATTRGERTLLDQELEALIDEIEEERQGFHAAQRANPENGHVSDVAVAFERTLEIMHRLGSTRPVRL